VDCVYVSSAQMGVSKDCSVYHVYIYIYVCVRLNVGQLLVLCAGSIQYDITEREREREKICYIKSKII